MQKLGLIIAAICLAFGPISAIPAAEKPTSGDVLTLVHRYRLPASMVGFAYVYQQKDADHYETIAKIPTRGGAGTLLWSPELNRYYVAAPATDKEAAILVHAPQD